MKHHSAANERIKRRYFTYLSEALGHSEQTIDAVAKAIRPPNTSMATPISAMCFLQ
jgi:hypothetical protein